MAPLDLSAEDPNSQSSTHGDLFPGSTIASLRLACATLAFLLLGSNLLLDSANGQSFSPATQWAADANLNDVVFIDDDRGWAVGDRGTILHSVDGGRSWNKLKSPVECTLECVFFLDRETGFIAGGYARPITHVVSGVVLKTTDGGQNWRLVTAGALPWVHRIEMDTAQRGWALVTRSAWSPSGIALTDNGGETWRPFSGNVEGEWTDAARTGASQFVVVGRDKTAGVSRRGELEDAIVVNPGRFDLTSLSMVDGQYGWAVGTSGTVAMTIDGGQTWDEPVRPRSAPEHRVSRQFDWQTVAALGNHVWVAGSPGTRIAHSVDQGRTWDWIDTGTSLPIRQLHFLNEKRGWAVGDGGVVLSTWDSGQSWHVTRQIVDRVTVLGIFQRVEDIPLELFARHAGNDGHFAAVAVTEPSPLANLHASPIRDRLRQALAEVGVSGLSWSRLNPYDSPPTLRGNQDDRSPDIVAPRHGNWPHELRNGVPRSSPRLLPSTGGQDTTSDVVSRNAFPSDEANEQLKEHLVRLIRQWRPDVIVSDTLDTVNHRLAQTSDEIALNGTITHQLLSEVFADAADPNAYREQLTEAGLRVWAPAKLYLKGARDTRVDEMLATNQFAARLGTSLEDYCLIRNGLIKAPELEAELRPGWNLHAATLPNPQAHRSLLSGLNQHSREQTRRALSPPGPGNLGVMQRQARKGEWIERVMATTRTSDGDPAKWYREVDRLLIGLDEMGKGNALFQVALEHEHRGQHEAAARAMHQIVTDCNQHPFWDAAMFWLVRYYASGEAKWRVDPESHEPHIQVASHTEPIEEEAVALERDGPTFAFPDEDPVQVPFSLQQMMRDKHVGVVAPTDRASHARKLWQLLYARQPRVAESAAMQIAMSAMHRRVSDILEVDSEAIVAARYSSPEWQEVGEIETWLRDGQDAPPVPVILCKTASEPPTLDGLLDDPLWQSTPEINLAFLTKKTLSDHPSASMRIARDAEFLYLAFKCETWEPIKPLARERAEPDEEADTDDSSDPNRGARRRDQVLTANDRIWLALDVDRDYVTAFSLEVDAHGRPRDMALESTDWDPQWFVAHRHQQHGWTLEMAVPFSQLQEVAPRIRDAWGIAVRRIPAGESSPVASQSLFSLPSTESILLFSE